MGTTRWVSLHNSFQTHRVSGLIVVDDVPEAGGGPDEGIGGRAGRAVSRVGQAVQDDHVAPHEVPVAPVLATHAAHLQIHVNLEVIITKLMYVRFTC